MLELYPLEYELAQDACCDLCNPHHVADYETTCVVVRSPGGNRKYVCVGCVQLLKRTWNSKAPQTNAEVIRRWDERIARAGLRRGQA